MNYNNLIKYKFKKFLISVIIGILAIPFSTLTLFTNPQKAKANGTSNAEIYATNSGGSNDALNKGNVTGAPDDNYCTVPSNTSDRYVYGKTYSHTLSGTITKVEIAAKYKVDNAFVDDQFKLKYKIGSTSNPDGETTFSIVPTNTSFSTKYLDVTNDRAWTWDDITNLYIYGINNVIGEADGNNLLIDALWVKVTYNTPIPSSAITYPLNNYHYNSLAAITGTATDNSGSGIKRVDIKIKRISDNKFFTGASWVAAEMWLPTLGTTNWSYSLDNSYLTNGEEYTITSRATDNNDNQESCPSVTFYYDTEKPTGSIVINNGADVTNGKGDYQTSQGNHPKVKLNFTAQDNIQIDKMQISNYPNMSSDPDHRNNTNEGWIDYTVEKEPWYLPDGDGLKTVYVQFKDKAGNESSIYQDSIFYSQYNDGAKQKTINTGNNENMDLFDDGSVIISANANSDTTLFYSSCSQNPAGSNSGITFLGKYYDFNFADPSAINFPVYIKIYYTEAELAAAGISENQLQGIYYFDFASNSWKLYSKDGLGSTTGVNKNENYVWANAMHLTPMSTGGDVTPPAKPANFTATAGNAEVELKWDPVDDATGYQVRYRESTYKDDSPYTIVYLSGKDSVTTKITGLTNGTQYEFGVAAKDDAGNLSEYAVVVQTPKYTGTTVKTDYSGVFHYVGTAYAADKTTKNDKKEEIKTNTNKDTGNIKSEEDEEKGGINWSKFAVTLGILILAAGAGFGGYYGYQWWMAGKEEEEDKKNKSKNKKEKRDNRW